MKKMICILLILVLAVPFALAEEKAEGPGFATPQEAAAAYVNALNAGDVPAMLATFSIETYVDRYDSRAYVERMRALLPNGYQGYPVTGTLSRGLWLEQRRNEIAGAVWRAYILFSTLGSDYEKVGQGMSVQLKEKEEFDRYIAYMQASSAEKYVGKLTVLGAYLPTDAVVSSFIPEGYFSEKSVEYRRIQQVIPAGCDEYADVIVLFNAGGILCAQFIGCARYGDVWYNQTLQGYLSSMVGMSMQQAGLVPLSELMR